MSFLPSKILDPSGAEIDSSALKNKKVIGLYFSAHWCPPCKAFTPKLSQWLADFKKTEKGDQMEIVFVTADRDEKSFKEYHSSMKTLHAIPFTDDAKDELSEKHEVSGIPALIFVDSAGEVINKRGRDIVESDPKAESFPFTPKPFSELFGTSFVNNKGEVVSAESFKDKHIGIYFSAHWCPPCRKFTPKLVEYYNKSFKDRMEIVFASSDKDQGSFDEYFNEMPWLAIPFSERQRKTELSGLFEVSGIPTLVILSPDGKLITSEGRGLIEADPEGKDFPWQPKPINSLNGGTLSWLNKKPSVIVFVNTDEQIKSVQDGLKDIADEQFKDPKLLFFYCDTRVAQAQADAVKGFINGVDGKAIVAIDVKKRAKYLAPSDDLTASNLTDFAKSVLDEKASKSSF
eukprot:m.263700 g.263700  ORF g.263700 m.263700 type:complete len:402 (-) comp27140_c0_seq1:67-1272(-)